MGTFASASGTLFSSWPLERSQGRHPQHSLLLKLPETRGSSHGPLAGLAPALGCSATWPVGSAARTCPDSSRLTVAIISMEPSHFSRWFEHFFYLNTCTFIL